MATLELQEAQPRSAPRPQTRDDEIAYLTQVRQELTDNFATMQKFQGMEPDQVLLFLSGFTARASEIRFTLARYEASVRRYAAFRTRELDPFIEECDRQFRIHSRLLSVRQLDWEMSGKGQP